MEHPQSYIGSHGSASSFRARQFRSNYSINTQDNNNINNNNSYNNGNSNSYDNIINNDNNNSYHNVDNNETYGVATSFGGSHANFDSASSSFPLPRNHDGLGSLFLPQPLTANSTTHMRQQQQQQQQLQPLQQLQQLQHQQPVSEAAALAAANWNNNAAHRGGGGLTMYSSTGVEGKAAPMRPGEGDCSVMVAAQNLMANYIPVFNPKGAVVDMYGPPHGHLEQDRYAEKIRGWTEAVEEREGGGANHARNENDNNAGRRSGGGGGAGRSGRAPEAAEDERRGWRALAAATSLAAERKERREGKSRKEGRNSNRSPVRYLQDAGAFFRSARGGARSNPNNNNNQAEEATATNYDDDLGECLDFIDDEYKEARENAKQYHKSLSKIFEVLKSSLKPGPPIGSRWDAFKNAFKAGNIAKCPELKLAKEFDAYQQVLVHPGSPLDESVSKMSQVYGLMCSAKEALEHDIKTLFLNPLYVFLDKEWKDVVAHDKAVQGLATKIQKAKAEGKDNETIADMMELFKHERGKTIYLFNFVLNSDYSQILKFIDLTQCYVDHHKENVALLENLMNILRHRANAAKPDDSLPDKKQPLGPASGLMAGCLGTCTIPCVPAAGLVTDTKADTREVEMEMQRIYGAKLPPRPADCGAHGKGQSCDPMNQSPQDQETPVASKSSCGGENDGSAAFLQYMENRIKTRPYGFVKEAFAASKPGEMTLHVGEIVYLRGKPGFDKYCGEKEDGTKGAFPQKALDVIVDIC